MRHAAKQETRRALIEAALVEFAEKGLDAPSLDAICARAGFTRGAFYVHFQDREQLLAAAMEQALRVLLDAVVHGEPGGERLEGIVDRYLARAVSGRLAPDQARDATARATVQVPLHQVMAACQRYAPTRELMLRILREGRRQVAAAARSGQRAGSVRRDVDAGDVAVLLMLLALGARAAVDLEVPFDVGRSRDALLALLRAPAAGRAAEARGKRPER